MSTIDRGTARRPRHHVEHVMGMAVSIDVRSAVTVDAVADVVGWLHHVDATFSTHKPTSPVSRFGLGEIGLDDLDAEVLGVLALCEELFEDTGGAFDALSVPAPNGSRFDPSGVVKGWAIERCAHILEAHGATDLCVNAGGDVAIRGESEPGQPWRVGIRHPALPHSLATVLSVRGPVGVATSGTYERGAHILDPATGQPTAGLASVTIVGPDITYADAYATTVFVMGLDGLTWLHDTHPDHAALVITHDDRTIATRNLSAYR